MDNPDDQFFKRLSETGPTTPESVDARPAAVAPARLKSKIYTALMRKQAESGRLASLSNSRDGGRPLCIFEQLVAIGPLPEQVQCANYCSICHARILAEHFEHAPIYWSHCPYVRFQNR
jgi:hypothetical protein